MTDEIGRYQIATSSDGADIYEIIIDTVTGRIVYRGCVSGQTYELGQRHVQYSDFNSDGVN